MYALIGDIHSSKEALEQVLQAIKERDRAARIIGTGDLFECTISKKDITTEKFMRLTDVLCNPVGFEDLLTFPSVTGNQEERILLLTETAEPLRQKLMALPGEIQLEGATVIHGHQWKWGGNPWSLQDATTESRLTFFGHSHTSALSINGTWQQVDFNVPYDVSEGEVLVNVGAVVDHREWVYYDQEKQTVTFKQVTA